jgi:hypothetical protein
LHHDTIAFTQHLFDAETEIGEAGDPAHNVLLDRLWAAPHCIDWHARSQLVRYTIPGEDRVRHVQPALIPQLLYELVDHMLRIIHRATPETIDKSPRRRSHFLDRIGARTLSFRKASGR